jgi:phage terminase large subunit-like protein
MVAEAQRLPATRLRGAISPRLAPPIPAKSDLAEYEKAAAELGIRLMPWQKVAARYITGKRGKGWAFREVVVVVARQNGKTTLLVPRILMGLKRGEQILHTAQNREIARKTFLALQGQMAGHDVIDYVRKGNGQEEIRSTTGGRYKLVAPNGGSRGETADLVLLDEVREQDDNELMDAILPTITARRNPQIVYLSNAGTESSIILNDLRRRQDDDKRLAYLEWSAEPHRGLDDYEGWAEANPALGYGDLTFETLEYFRANRPPASFETEHLCRWVETMMPSLVADAAWAKCAGYVENPVRPMLGINIDPSGSSGVGRTGVAAERRHDRRPCRR